ncbi:MAG: DUF6314 family protein [Pikeienuella sp.]
MIFATEAWFRGRWKMTRKIEDRRGPDAVFTGVAEFTPLSDAVLAYREVGELSLGDSVMTAERQYVWKFGQNGEISVDFSDGRYFHSFNPEQNLTQARHLCVDDIYDVQFEFDRENNGVDVWQCIWRVAGPRKDYVSHTEFVRMPKNLEN